MRIVFCVKCTRAYHLNEEETARFDESGLVCLCGGRVSTLRKLVQAEPVYDESLLSSVSAPECPAPMNSGGGDPAAAPESLSHSESGIGSHSDGLTRPAPESSHQPQPSDRSEGPGEAPCSGLTRTVT
jgi:hypothetical protein